MSVTTSCWIIDSVGRNDMHICQTWCTSSSLNPGSIRQSGGQAERSAGIKRVQQAGTNAVIDDADAATNRGLATVAKETPHQAVVAFWRPSKGKPRTEVVLVPIVEARFSTVGRTAKAKGNEGILIRWNSFCHVLATLIEPLPHVQRFSRRIRGRNLKPVGLPWWREKRIAKTKGYGQIGLHFPGILGNEAQSDRNLWSSLFAFLSTMGDQRASGCDHGFFGKTAEHGAMVQSAWREHGKRNSI